MCTVFVRVPDSPSGTTTVLAVRDEDPERGWDPLGQWWPDTHPGVIGVRDRRAGGAWLAADTSAGRLAVLLNRADNVPLTGAGALKIEEYGLVSRGTVVLDAVAGIPPDAIPRTRGFTLLTVDGGRVRTVVWDGSVRREAELSPGTHGVAHDDVDDPGTARIARWLPEFAAAPDAEDSWWRLLARSAELPATVDEAIIRDNRPFGYPTQSLLVCRARVSVAGADVRYDELPAPGHWYGQP